MFDPGRIAVIISIIFHTSDCNVLYVLIASASWERMRQADGSMAESIKFGITSNLERMFELISAKVS